MEYIFRSPENLKLWGYYSITQDGKYQHGLLGKIVEFDKISANNLFISIDLD